jgi:hypothetical protein
MDKRPEGACCGNCCAWLKTDKEPMVVIGEAAYGSIYSFKGKCHMLPNLVDTLANHFCFMWRKEE